MAVGVLANAVINVVGNMSGWRSAMRETQTQLWGLLTLSNRMGGMIARNLVTPIAAHQGMQAIYEAQQRGQLAAQHAMQQWQQNRPQLQMPPLVLNPQDFAFAMKQARAQLAIDLRQWRQQKPNANAIINQEVEGAGLAAGRAAFLLSGLLGLGRAFVTASQYASNFREELNKITQTFGSSTGTVMRGIEAMGAQGVGRTAMMSGVGSMGIELLGSGMSERIATDLAMKLGQRALDVSSLYNISQESALAKFKSGLAGFGRPLKELGVVLTENGIEVEAFASGLWDGRSALSDEVKMQARANVILRETERAEGDYMRTQHELANQYRALEGNVSNLLETLGNSAVIQGFTYGLNQLTIGVNDSVKGWQQIYKAYYDTIFKGAYGAAPSDIEKEMAEGEASNRNLGSQSRAYADDVIKSYFLGEGRRARHSGIADIYKNVQEGVFNDKGRVQLDLTRRLVDLTEMQVRLLQQLGHTNLNPAPPM